MNISLPDALKNFVDTQVSQGHYGTSSEYIRELIRKDQERQQLKTMLLEGAQSAVQGEFDQDYFESLRQEVKSSASK